MLGCSVSFDWDHDLKNQSFKKRLRVLHVKLFCEVYVVGHFEVGVLLIEPEDDFETDPFEEIQIGIVGGRQVDIQIKNLLHEDHEAVNVELNHLRQIKGYRRVQQFEDTDEDVGGLLVEVLEKLRSQVQKRNQTLVAKVVQFDIL